jgi:hypothetical protein
MLRYLLSKNSPWLMLTTAESVSGTEGPPLTSPIFSTHKHTEPSIGDIVWKTADELRFPDGNEGQKAGPLSTTFGTTCILGEGCVVKRTATDLFVPGCPLDSLHSECWLTVAGNENQHGKWKLPTSLVSTCRPRPDDREQNEKASGADGSITVGETKE